MEIIAALKAYRVPHERIASVIGRDRTVATKMLQGKRSIKVNEIDALTNLVETVMREHGGVPPHAEVVNLVLTPSAGDLAGLPVREAIQAGAWLEVASVIQVEYPEPVIYPATPDARYPRAAQWVRPVRGDSMNALVRNGHPAGIFDGDIVHIVDAIAISYTPTTGDIVEVERSRFDGREIQITLKEVEVSPDGTILLWPRSTNPRWRDPIPYKDGMTEPQHESVRVSGKVLRHIRDI